MVWFCRIAGISESGRQDLEDPALDPSHFEVCYTQFKGTAQLLQTCKCDDVKGKKYLLSLSCLKPVSPRSSP
jgi:hypothetical protein